MKKLLLAAVVFCSVSVFAETPAEWAAKMLPLAKALDVELDEFIKALEATPPPTEPVENGTLIVPAGTVRVIDKTIPRQERVEISGELQFADVEMTFRSGVVIVHEGGVLKMGTPEKPLTKRIDVIIDGTDDNAVPPMLPHHGSGGGRGIIGMPLSTIEIHGVAPVVPWTMLLETVQAGSKTIRLKVSPGWRVGQEIILTTTNLSMQENERRIIKSISGDKITVTEPFTYRHLVDERKYDSGLTGVPMWIRRASECGLITRDLRIYAPEDDLLKSKGYGVHIMSMGQGSALRVSGAQIFNAGQSSKLARYAIHWHSLLGSGRGCYARGNSIQSYNRAITFHNTDDAEAVGNLIYGSHGHSIFYEDGSERNCAARDNLICNVRHMSEAPGGGANLDVQPEFGNTFGAASGIWITSRTARVTGNYVAGVSEFGAGIWYSVIDHLLPTSVSIRTMPAGYNPLLEPFGEFGNNVAHGVPAIRPSEVSQGFGLVVTSGVGKGQITGWEEFADFMSYDCGGGGLWSTSPANYTRFAVEMGQHAFSPRANCGVVDSLIVLNPDAPFEPGVPSDNPGYRSVLHPYEAHTLLKNSAVFGANEANRACIYSHRPGINVGRDNIEGGKFTNSDIIGWISETQVADPESQTAYKAHDLTGVFGRGVGTYFHEHNPWLPDVKTINVSAKNTGPIKFLSAFFTPSTICDFTLYGSHPMKVTRDDGRDLGVIPISGVSTRTNLAHSLLVAPNLASDKLSMFFCQIEKSSVGESVVVQVDGWNVERGETFLLPGEPAPADSYEAFKASRDIGWFYEPEKRRVFVRCVVPPWAPVSSAGPYMGILLSIRDR